MLEFYLTEEAVIALHNDIIKKTGGTHGVRDMGLLSSAINAPFQSFDGNEIYPTIYEKASRLAFGLIQNHAFIDGNKRIAAHIMLIFLSVNGIELYYSQEELEDLFLALASSEITQDELTKWLKKHSYIS